MFGALPKITTLKPFVHKNEKMIYIFSFYSFFEKKKLREFWCPPPLKPKHNHDIYIYIYMKRKFERKFWNLSAPSQIVAGPLRLKHNLKNNNVIPSFFFEK